MAFNESLAEAIEQASGRDKAILEYLATNAIGRVNAKPWSAINAHLRANGFGNMQQTTFQQTLLKKTRESSLFILSCDRAPHKGYFIAAEKEDAEVMVHWYKNRIASEETNLYKLEELISQRWL